MAPPTANPTPFPQEAPDAPDLSHYLGDMFRGSLRAVLSHRQPA